MNNSLPITVLAEGVCKSFSTRQGKIHAVNDLSLCICAGGLTALVGADGAGKTTLMRMLAGLLTPSAGRLQVLGVDVSQNPQAVQSRISYMPQRFGLYEDLSVQENLDLYANLHGVPHSIRQQRFARMLEMTDMARFTTRPAGKLSGGMKQKLGLACTLVRSPDLLLLDEPSVGVDPLSRRDLWRIVQQLVEAEGLSVIVSTAYMDEAERCAHVFVLHQGRLLAEGTPQTLTQRACGLTFTVKPPPDIPARNVQARLMDAGNIIVDAVPQGGAIRFIQQPNTDRQALHVLLGDLPCAPRPAELEDAFMLLLRRQVTGLPGTSFPAQEAQSQCPHTGQAAAPPPLSLSHKQKKETESPAIIVRDLVRRFDDFTAVASTSFDVRRGEIFGLLGPNGAGKTTTFRMLCGLLPASGGQLEVAGVNLRHARARARARIGYVSQKFALYSNLTVQENLRFFGAAYGLRRRVLQQRIAAMLTQFELRPHSISGQLPAGYKQRLAMAAALLHEPDILFLDEPTSGIDPLARRAFWRTMTALAQSGVTIIITTHFMEEAEYCDRIVIQDAGKLLAIGTPQQVRQQAGSHGDMSSAFIAIVEQGRTAALQQRPER